MNFLVNKYLLGAAVAAATTFNAAGIAPGDIRWTNEREDTTALTNMLVEAAAMHADHPADLVVPIGKMLLDKPYAGGGIEGEPEMLTVRLDSLDCTTFVESVLAAAKTAYMGRTSWRDFAQTLKEMRYRGGEINGYGSRLHYFSDWIVENSHRGDLQDVTDRIGKGDHMVKTLDFMSRNRSKYPAMKDDANYNAIKNAEVGYRSHRFAYIKPINFKSAALKEGDIIGIVTSIPGLDVTHMGIVTMVNGEPHLLHASSAKGKVVVDELTLADYIKRNRKAVGIRVIRLKD